MLFQPLIALLFQWQIRLGETLCYKFSSTGSKEEVNTIEVTYLEVRHIYSVANSYYFKLAQTDVKCICDCPGGGNTCSSITNR